MAFRLRRSPFEAARPLIDRIQARGWIWQGRQPLDGLVCVKGWFVGEGWIAALTPWLGKASGVKEDEHYVLLTFDKPVLCDCDALGRVLPLRMAHGGLASFPLALSGEVAGIASQLLLIEEGERVMAPLSGFRPVDAARWWSLDEVAAEESQPLPLSTFGAREGLSLGTTPFDPDASEAGLDGVAERIRKARPSLWRVLTGMTATLLGALARIFVWLVILGLISSIISALATGGSGEAIGRLLVYAIALGLYLLFWPSKKLIGPPDASGSGKGKAPAASGGASGIRQPGFLRRAAGWLVWNSALGKGVRGQYSKRLQELEALFAQGRLDEALRKAIALGAERKDDKPARRGWFGDFPLGAPGMRANLDIRMKVAEVAPYNILTGGGFEAVQELYRKQAEALAERGDYQRAAFIYAELLNDPLSAVRLFERKGDYATAARLAQGRRLGPAVFIPLWYKAGEKPRALRLAAQFDAYAALLSAVPDTDPFHKDLVAAWAHRLVETGDYARALAMTEKYADLAAQRRLWMVAALERDVTDAAVVARALKAIPSQGRAQMQALFDRLLAKPGAEPAHDRAAVAGLLADANFEKAATDAHFYSKHLPLLALPLLRRLLDDDVAYGTEKARRDAAMSLAEAAGQFALRVDLRRLNRLAPKPEDAPVRTVTLAPLADAAPIRDMVCLAGGRMLIAYASGAIVLTARDGRRLWSDHIHAVKGLAAIGEGNRVIVVRQEVEGTALSLLNLDERSHKDIGYFAINEFSRHASEIGWQVLVGNRVALLDTASLIAAAGKGGGPLEHHWEIPMTEPGRICAFRNTSTEDCFLYQRQLGGLVEHWTLQKLTLRVDCRFVLPSTRGPIPEIETYGWLGAGYFCVRDAKGEQLSTVYMALESYSREAEQRLLKENKPWLLPGQSVAALGIGTLPLHWCSERTVPKTASVPSTKAEPAARAVNWFASTPGRPGEMFTASFPEAKGVQVRIMLNSPTVAVFDDLGRVLLLDFTRRKVLFRNDGLLI